METPAAEVEAVIGHAAPRRRQGHSQPGTGAALSPLAALRQVEILVLNEHEAAALCGVLGLPHAAPADQVAALARDLGNTVIITLGAEGAIGAQGDATMARRGACR